MAASRKDSKGRVLKSGKSERKDGLYQYRYTEATGERKIIYANNLNDLRKKEQEIQKLLDLGVSYFEGSMTVTSLLERYFALKQHPGLTLLEVIISRSSTSKRCSILQNENQNGKAI